MEESMVDCLKKRHCKSDSLGPQVKFAKFGNIHSSVSFDILNKTVYPQILSSAIRQAFPRKRCGHDRATHVFGIEEMPKDIDSPNVHDVLQQNAQLQEENVQLNQKVKQLEDRVCELEQKCVTCTSSALERCNS